MGRYGRKHHEIEEETGGDAAELNLTPYLDIMMNLVIFLIFSFQVIIEFRLIDVVPPAVGASSSSPPDPSRIRRSTRASLVACNGGIDSAWLATRADCGVAAACNGACHFRAAAPCTRRD